MRVLYLDDDVLVSRAVAKQLRDACAVATVTNAYEALSILPFGHWDAVISDFSMPGKDGADFMREVAAAQPETIRIFVTGNPDHRKVRRALQDGVVARVFGKPVDMPALRQALGLPLR